MYRTINMYVNAPSKSDFPVIDEALLDNDKGVESPRFGHNDVRADLGVKAETPFEVLKRFPHIFEEIKKHWGTQVLQEKFIQWTLTDQDSRIGWPKDMVEALIAASNIHYDLHQHLFADPALRGFNTRRGW